MWQNLTENEKLPQKKNLSAHYTLAPSKPFHILSDSFDFLQFRVRFFTFRQLSDSVSYVEFEFQVSSAVGAVLVSAQNIGPLPESVLISKESEIKFRADLRVFLFECTVFNAV